ncbi:class I SAM-dependent methyltransferase [Paenibacillus alba]|uniref:class I SAM-dependent methyltransferase n=1 Tax=Paenibacillus alba TaxID=1197127 RepID=UPI00156563F4|nr:class I SAM-dependent methyltransferase [Paenibacillus alba]NQX65202.1 class I SAM-dependent methyltransferase [Paenibacillus alba]
MDNKERFSNRVDVYVKYRPTYPAAMLDYLYSVVGLSQGSTVADVGAGTGIFSSLLLARGSNVIAVEPNQAMRLAAEQKLNTEAKFQAVGGAAEATGLSDQSVDFIVCAQSFHWFDRAATQAEFRRILKPGGKVVLIWNSRLTEGTPFLEAYEQLLLTFGTDYEQVKHKNISADSLAQFFKQGGMKQAQFTMGQALDLEALKGRLLSSSYSPLPGHANYEPMIAEIEAIFDRTQQEGVVHFDYETLVYWGEV